MTLINVDDMHYVNYIEQTYLYYRQCGTHLSPLEYDLIYSWETDRIPVEVVCRTLSTINENCKLQNKTYPHSLLYFKRPVKETFKAYLAKQVGK